MKQEFLLEDYLLGTKDMKNVHIKTYKKEDGPKIELGAI